MRRGRETVGDLDILVTGKACCDDGARQDLIDHIIKLPGLMEIIARGDNKISFRLRGGMQVDVRLLPPDSFGAAMQYFTGSKAHNVALRQRALKMGYTLSEYSLADLETEKPVAGKTEEEIYAKLKLDYIPPELRENLGEIDAAAAHTLPSLITQADLQGDVHMHTVETDGRNTIEEMAEAAEDMATSTWPSPTTRRTWHLPTAWTTSAPSNISSAFAPSTTARRASQFFAGIEVDILADGTLDLSDSVLEQMDIVIASVHSHFNQSAGRDDRPSAQSSGESQHFADRPSHRTHAAPPRCLRLRHRCRAEGSRAKKKVAMELNAYPDRLDLNDRHLRLAKEHGVKIVINTDSHHTSHLDKIRFGILQARRAWLTKEDVLNTLPLSKFAKAMKHAW